jgi:hypothetical protein
VDRLQAHAVRITMPCASRKRCACDNLPGNLFASHALWFKIRKVRL